METMTSIKIAVTAAILAITTFGMAEASGIEGRWIRECGEGTFCRLSIERTGKSSYAIVFMHTRPSGRGTPTDNGSEPDPTICEWHESLAARGSDGVSPSGLTARPMADGRINLSGIPDKCKKPGRAAVFDRDEVDEFGDI